MNAQDLTILASAMAANVVKPEPQTKKSNDPYPEPKPVPMVTRPKFSKFGKLSNHQRVIALRAAQQNMSIDEYIAKYSKGHNERKLD